VGIAGAAIATCVSQLVQLVLLWVIVGRKRTAFGVRGSLVQRPPYAPPKLEPQLAGARHTCG